uniref:ARAD1D22616p n=1 Tax=Blastobotrys adeninivorans TaxID=409370 RepID=A0A060T9X7_BLAAD
MHLKAMFMSLTVLAWSAVADAQYRYTAACNEQQQCLHEYDSFLSGYYSGSIGHDTNSNYPVTMKFDDTESGVEWTTTITNAVSASAIVSTGAELESGGPIILSSSLPSGSLPSEITLGAQDSDGDATETVDASQAPFLGITLLLLLPLVAIVL